MTWPSKVLLPGGRGLFNELGQFVINAGECCCESQSGSVPNVPSEFCSSCFTTPPDCHQPDCIVSVAGNCDCEFYTNGIYELAGSYSCFETVSAASTCGWHWQMPVCAPNWYSRIIVTATTSAGKIAAWSVSHWLAYLSKRCHLFSTQNYGLPSPVFCGLNTGRIFGAVTLPAMARSGTCPPNYGCGKTYYGCCYSGGAQVCCDLKVTFG